MRQYTLRAVPPLLDRTLRRQTRQQRKRLNAVALEALAKGLELVASLIVHTDLHALIGSWQEDSAFDQAVADFEKIDDSLWK